MLDTSSTEAALGMRCSVDGGPTGGIPTDAPAAEPGLLATDLLGDGLVKLLIDALAGTLGNLERALIKVGTCLADVVAPDFPDSLRKMWTTS